MQNQTAQPRTKVLRYREAIWTLLFLAPFIAEVLSGATRLSVLFVLVPEMMVWGGGALLARELVRRWRAGVISLFLLGLALSIAEEFIVQQTSLAPLPFPGANVAYGRYFGVNWIYFLFMLAYESGWVVLVPVQVTELLFPAHRDKPWLRTRGIIVCIIAFALGCRAAWYGWTQRALPAMHVRPYHPPILALALGLIAIAALAGLAFLLRACGHSLHVSRHAVSPWVVGIAALVFGCGWWALMTLVFMPHPRIAAPTAVLLGILWAIIALALLLYWSESAGWTDMHRWSAAFGATVSCMLPGYISTAGWSKPDLIFKIVMDVAAVIGLLSLARVISQRRADE